MQLRNISLALLLFMAANINAQQRVRYNRHVATDTVSTLVRVYTDSLGCLQQKLDSMPATATISGRYYRMFAPTTFYHDIAHRAFSIDSKQQSPDAPLLYIYLSRPDLVAGTQTQLEAAGGIVAVSNKTLAPKQDIVTKTDNRLHDKGSDISPEFDILIHKPNFWTFKGDYSLQMFQNYVSDNWYKGGESNYSMLATATMQATYDNKNRFRWDNKLEMRLGFQNSRGDTLHSIRASEDLLRYTGKVGLQATQNWYYTLQLIATTQFMRGLKSNDPVVYSDFLAPLTITPSIGMDYSVCWFKGKLTGSAHLAPIAYNLTYVRNKQLAPRFGIEEGKHTKDDFGSEITVDLNWLFTKDIKWKTRLYAYTTYKHMLMEWENTFTFIVNKYISANVFLYPRFDDAAKRDADHGFWQLKEFVSLGFSYSL